MVLTEDRIRELFYVDLEKGELWHKGRLKGGQPVGLRAGYIANKGKGYRIICIDYLDYFEHNLIWFLTRGGWPPIGREVDHKNRIKSDNQPDNLRLATRSQNNANAGLRSDNKTGARGVYFDVSRNKFSAQITINKKTYGLGRFNSFEEAAKTAAQAREKLFGEFAHSP